MHPLSTQANQFKRSEADPVRHVIGWAGLAGLAYLVYLVLEPSLIPLGWAAVFAIAVHPVYSRLERRWGATRASAVSTLAVTVILVVPAILITPVFVREGVDAAARVQRAIVEGRFGWLEPAWLEIVPQMPAAQQVDLAAVMADLAHRGVALLVSQSGLVLRDATRFVFHLVVALFATFFVLRDSDSIVRATRRLMPLPEASREEVIARTMSLVSVSLSSALIVAAVQGLLGGLVFLALGIPSPVFWGVVMALFCLLPFGAWMIWLPAALLLALDGQITRALVLAALGLAIISAADNVLRPMLVSGRAHMNGLVILVGLLGGLGVFGVLGLVLGPVIVATALALLAAYIDAPDGSRLA